MVNIYKKPVIQEYNMLGIEKMIVMAESGEEFPACPTCQFGVDEKNISNPKCQICKTVSLGNTTRYDFCQQTKSN